jgi:(R,R)-butanediol dehydrogenase/meso-butanediol dehydrogenase/diacetyl reductase
MKAAVFRGVGNKLAIEDLPAPEAGPGEVVLRVDYCGICGSDLHATLPGAFTIAKGVILGHEFAGVVVDSGTPAVTVGERATAVPIRECDACRPHGECQHGRGILCANNAIVGFTPATPGAYAEYVKVGAKHLIPLPPQVTPEQGAMVEPLAVGLNAVERAGVKIGDRVLVLGAGPIGLAVASFARIAGARDVVVSEFAAGRRETAAKFGATGVIDPAREDVTASFERLTGGKPDIVFECVGVPGLLEQAVGQVRSLGKIAVVGVCMTEDRWVPFAAISKAITMQFMLGYTKPHFAIVLDYLNAGRIDALAMVTDVVGLDALPDAFEALRKPQTQIKVMLRPHAA